MLLYFFGFLAVVGCGQAVQHGLLGLEPANALSLPTWIVHSSSVLEYGTAMGLVWRLADVTGIEQWRGLTYAMLPSFAGALTACTFHFFYNSPELNALVALQVHWGWGGGGKVCAGGGGGGGGGRLGPQKEGGGGAFEPPEGGGGGGV